MPLIVLGSIGLAVYGLAGHSFTLYGIGAGVFLLISAFAALREVGLAGLYFTAVSAAGALGFWVGFTGAFPQVGDGLVGALISGTIWAGIGGGVMFLLPVVGSHPGGPVQMVKDLLLRWRLKPQIAEFEARRAADTE